MRRANITARLQNTHSVIDGGVYVSVSQQNVTLRKDMATRFVLQNTIFITFLLYLFIPGTGGVHPAHSTPYRIIAAHADTH